jgi:hypothetical protein
VFFQIGNEQISLNHFEVVLNEKVATFYAFADLIAQILQRFICGLFGERGLRYVSRTTFALAFGLWLRRTIVLGVRDTANEYERGKQMKDGGKSHELSS